MSEGVTPQNGPLLSICIPTYNRADLLRRTLNSFENGTPELEVIICDNSDNDKSRSVVNEIMLRFRGSWQYHKNEPPLGPVDNMNKAILLSKGKYVYVFHDDDYLLDGGIPTIIEKLLQNPNERVFLFGVKLVDINERTLRIQSPKHIQSLQPHQAIYNLLKDSSYIRMPSIVIRRDAYDEVGLWDPSKAPPDDFDMFTKLLTRFGAIRIPEMVAAYTIHDGAWTEKMFNEETIEILLQIFRRVEQEGILDYRNFQNAKAHFFHKFILAGAYRSLRRGKFDAAKKVMNLFSMREIENLPLPIKWFPVRYGFKLLVSIA